MIVFFRENSISTIKLCATVRVWYILEVQHDIFHQIYLLLLITYLSDLVIFYHRWVQKKVWQKNYQVNCFFSLLKQQSRVAVENDCF